MPSRWSLGVVYMVVLNCWLKVESQFFPVCSAIAGSQSCGANLTGIKNNLTQLYHPLSVTLTRFSPSRPESGFWPAKFNATDSDANGGSFARFTGPPPRRPPIY